MSDGDLLRVIPLGDPPWPTADPFLFCVHHHDAYPAGNERMGPATSLAGRELGQDFAGKDGWRMYHGGVVPGFPAHPHRGFETVTIMRRGLCDHSDSLGATARFGAGDVQWMTAGRGIVHAEMFPLVERARENPLELFQIWLNLPAAGKMVEPHFSMLWSETIPRVAAAPGVEVTVVAGALGDARVPPPPPRSWAADARAGVIIWTIRMDAGARWRLPAAAAGVGRTLYVVDGGSSAGGQALARGQGAALGEGTLALDAGERGCDLLLLGGRPIGEPVVAYGPFVMNTRAEIQDAFADYQRTRFGGWPWASDDPVHAREDGRFARHVGGRVDRPGG